MIYDIICVICLKGSANDRARAKFGHDSIRRRFPAVPAARQQLHGEQSSDAHSHGSQLCSLHRRSSPTRRGVKRNHSSKSAGPCTDITEVLYYCLTRNPIVFGRDCRARAQMASLTVVISPAQQHHCIDVLKVLVLYSQASE